MSRSSLWVMDKEYKGYEVIEFRNSWLFSPIIWGVLADKYIPHLIVTPYGFKKNVISDPSLFKPLNDKINNCKCTPDRICWEMSNQQVFFTKDKEVITKSILEFISLNSKYDKNSEGTYPLQAEHIINRFKEIASEILKLDANEYPYFIFKNTSVDDNVECWFSKYDESQDEYIQTPLSDIDKHVTEFVFIEDGAIKAFKSNVEYFNKTSKLT